jgi:nucleoside phosphorylase
MSPNEPASASTNAPVDFLFITAIEQERDALLSKLPGVRKLDRDGSGAHTYYEASVATRREDRAVYRVIVTSLSGMGPIKGAIKAGAVIQRWKPIHVLVVGIAGGVEGEVAPGDVMVASQVADYTVGKVRDGAPREERWMPYQADADLLDAAAHFPTGWEDLVASAPPEAATPSRHVGVIASGGDVVASKEQIRLYLADLPKLIGVEMEGGGVAAGLHDDIARPRFLMIRGVSDLANGDDNAAMKKAWRAYACHVAAAYAIGLLRDGPVKAGASQDLAERKRIRLEERTRAEVMVSARLQVEGAPDQLAELREVWKLKRDGSWFYAITGALSLFAGSIAVTGSRVWGLVFGLGALGAFAAAFVQRKEYRKTKAEVEALERDAKELEEEFIAVSSEDDVSADVPREPERQ